MFFEKECMVHEDVIVPDDSQDNQDDARLNENFFKCREYGKVRKVDKDKSVEKKTEKKSTEKISNVVPELIHS